MIVDPKQELQLEEEVEDIRKAVEELNEKFEELKENDNPILVCDLCNFEFELLEGALKTVRIDNVDITYFECPRCNRKYIAHCKDKYLRDTLRTGRIKSRKQRETMVKRSKMLAIKYKHKIDKL